MNIENKYKYKAVLTGILVFGASFGASFGATACGKELRSPIVDSATSTPVSASASPTPKGSERLAVFTVTPRPEATQVPSAPRPEVKTGPKAGEFILTGFPNRVDAKNVDTAKGDFKNTVGQGSEMILAEPGVLKVGWDFPQDQFQAAGEHIYHYDSGNQFVLQQPESFVNVPEGAFSMFNGNAMNIEVSGNDSASFRLEIPGPVSNHNIVIVRGLYPDGSTPADRNRIAKVTGYTPGAVLYDMYPRGGFVSEGQFKQVAKNALTNSPNCGAEACRTVRGYFFDLNTGAFSAIVNSGQTWEAISSNWR